MTYCAKSLEAAAKVAETVNLSGFRVGEAQTAIASRIRSLPTSPSPDIGETVEKLRELASKILPISINETPDYAELTFGEHQTQAMTMDPQTWVDLNETLPTLLTALEQRGDDELDVGGRHHPQPPGTCRFNPRCTCVPGCRCLQCQEARRYADLPPPPLEGGLRYG